MKWKESGNFENPTPGSHIARCYGLIDLGTQKHSWNGEEWNSRDVRILFELPNELMEGKYNEEVKGKPFTVGITVKQSMHQSSKLRPFLEAWRGKKFTKEELQSYDPRKLIGAPCRLALVENGDYVNIDGVARLGKNEECPPAVNKPIYVSLDPADFDQEAFARLGEKQQHKIKGTPEWAALTRQDADEQPPADHEPEAPAPSDDVPF